MFLTRKGEEELHYLVAVRPFTAHDSRLLGKVDLLSIES